MKKNYYISDIQFIVNSEIPLDEYEGEMRFQTFSLKPEKKYFVKVNLVTEIVVPGSKPVEVDNCRIWPADSSAHPEEIRIYSFSNISDQAICSTLSGNQITIKVLKSLWNINFFSFRIWSYIFLEKILLENDALILHSASIIHNDKAILFTAPSETGKTTQTDIWHRNDTSVKDLNGDRTILQKTVNGWIACGIPISGTSERCEQISVPIAAIAFVNRAEIDTISYPDVIRKIQFLYGQITVPSVNEHDAEKALNLLEDLIDQVKIVQLNCTMKDSAYQVLLEEIEQH